MVLTAYAMAVPQDVNTRRGIPVSRGQRANGQQAGLMQNGGPQNGRTPLRQQRDARQQAGAATPDDKITEGRKDSLTTRLDEILKLDTEEIPDSLLHPRWGIQRTTPITFDDLSQGSADLRRPENLEQKVEYNDSIERYIFGYKIGGTYIDAPLMMTLDEYLQHIGKQQRSSFYRQKNSEIFEAKGKEKFDFTDMHFDLGPAEKIFGPGGVRITTRGTAELKFGATLKNIDNPSLPIRNRKTTTINFDEKINVNVTGKVGDKVNMGLTYNTDATFNFDQQNIKLKYEGKDDEIIKLLEAGNVSFPSNSSLVQGASSLFGIRTDLQFGKLKLQTVISQKKSNSKSVSTKGGVQYTPFEIEASNYEENRHFFLSHYFRDKYDAAMATLPNLTTGIKIGRVEIWVTNKNGSTTNTRNVVALTDLGETSHLHNDRWGGTTNLPPDNSGNTEYQTMAGQLSAARDIDQASSTLDGASLVGGADYEKIERARQLSTSEYTINTALGYISLKSTLQTDQVLAVAYEYTYGGRTYQVGEFSSDVQDNTKALFVKSVKNAANNPQQGNWGLMMKNVYYLATNIEKTKFRLDVKFQSDTAGVYLTYIPEQQVKGTPLIRLLGADRLDNNNKPHSNGYFDYVEGYTISDGRVFLPAAEPFGRYMYNYLTKSGVAPDRASRYAYTELYDSTKTVARQIAEKNKYLLQGQFKGTAGNVISLGAYNVPRGSVVVTAGGMTLSEGADYTVDYSAGEVTIINQSIIDAGTPVNVSLESDTDYGQQRKTMFGLNWEYDFSKNFQMSGTFQHLSEQALTTKVSMGSEPLNNTLWGVNLNWKQESQWLTNILDKLPFLHLTAPSSIQLSAEFAQLIAGTAGGTQDNASYLDDFENAKETIDVSSPTSWTMSSVPSFFAEHTDKQTLRSGQNRALMAWYTIDPLFTRRSSSLTPSHIKGDLQQLSNHYVREVYVNELFPNRDQSSYTGATNTLSVMNIAFYPDERGPYNFSTELDAQGHLLTPEHRWGGMMRKLDTSDFEAANVEYIEFWMLDPFIQGKNAYDDITDMGGDMYINLGDVSEDILLDGKKFYESGMPIDGSEAYTTTQWGKIPTQAAVTYAFSTQAGTRQKQDTGFNGLTDEEERAFPGYQDFLSFVQNNYAATDSAYINIMQDPAADNYSYFRSTAFDQQQTPILQRYKHINGPQGNSPDSEQRSEAYDTSYKTTPDVEDINQDYTLNEYEKYYQYRVPLYPGQMRVGENYIVDKRVTSKTLRNGDKDSVTWYQFRIPLKEVSPNRTKVGSINDFTSIRFMRMFLTNFKRPVVLRFATFDLVHGKWRVYEQNLNPSAPNTGVMSISAVNIEENNDKTPVNYVLPPGISRIVDPSQPQLVQSNEQALSMTLTDMSTGDARCVYKNTTIDLRNYKRLQLFAHAHAFENNTTGLRDNQLALFVRLGSDYKSNYYEYEIPLKLTAAGKYNQYSLQDCRAVWPEDNMLDIDLSLFTQLKKERNIAKSSGQASYNKVFTAYDEDKPNNRISIMGNPTLGEVKTIVIGVRNLSSEMKAGEVWVNELRLKDTNNEGGWAAQGNMNVQLSDLGTVNVAGRYLSSGFGGLEESIMQRSTEDFSSYSATVNVELGKFFPDKAKVTAPIYYSVTKEKTSPKYNPLDSDMRLKDALDAYTDKAERDSVENIAVTKTTTTNFSLSNVRVGIQTKHHPMPYDPANFSFSYSHSHVHKQGETTVYENEDTWRGSLNYQWSPVYKAYEPFKKIKSKSKYYDILRRFGLNWLPQSVAFNTEMTRNYYELQERDMEQLEGSSPLPLTFSSQFLWNRDFNLRWDLTPNLQFSFQSATHAEIEEPYTAVNKDLYPERYEAWKDSVWTSIKHLGTPLDYSQNVSASYRLPLNLIPIFDWLTADGSYSSTYNWQRGTDLDDGTSLGNTVAMNRTVTLNGAFSMEKLYNHVPFLKKTNERFNKRPTYKPDAGRKKTTAKKDGEKDDSKGSKKGKKQDALKAALPFNKNTTQVELKLYPDSAIVMKHNRKSKRLIVSARSQKGKQLPIVVKKTDDNSILVRLKSDTAQTVKLSVTKKPDLETFKWYRTAQSAARLLMMVRNVSFTYRNNYSLSLPGFMPSVGDIFGQKRHDGIMSPGLDFAFGFVGDEYIDRAREHGWLLNADSVATPATTNKTEDLQLRMTLEPIRDLKIDLNASRTMTRAKSVQYMYEGSPTTHSGTFTMTTLSLGSAFEGLGNSTNGFRSKTFERFCESLPRFRERVESQYTSARYPEGTSLAGQPFDPANGGVSQYSADVMVPAFLNAYTSMGDGLGIFPSLSRLLPNWSLKYSGLGQLSWFRELFKSVTLSHAYKSVYAVGSYSSFSTYMEFMNGLGFVTNTTTGSPVPSSMYNVSQVSINESFSPLLGLDFTFYNNMSVKMEYRSTRVLNLSMTSVQLSETTSKDWVLGFGYKIQDFNLFSRTSKRRVKGSGSSSAREQQDSKQTKSSRRGFSHDLDLRLDVSYRRQAAINRDIMSMTSTATSGNNAFKLSFSADYTMSRLLTMSFYLDRQTNKPLLSNNSYPTTTQDFGLSLKFSLTR